MKGLLTAFAILSFVAASSVPTVAWSETAGSTAPATHAKTHHATHHKRVSHHKKHHKHTVSKHHKTKPAPKAG